MPKRQGWLAREMSLPTFKPGDVEEIGYARGYRIIAGLDEVGVGPLAGPVVACAVTLCVRAASTKVVEPVEPRRGGAAGTAPVILPGSALVDRAPHGRAASERERLRQGPAPAALPAAPAPTQALSPGCACYVFLHKSE